MNNKNKWILLLLLNSAIASADEVTVKTSDGTVYISGNVASDNQAVLLDQVVNAIPEATDSNIENLNIGQTKHPIPDEMLTAKINGGFMRAALFGTDANFDNITIKVETNDGVVTLSGTAESEQQLQNAIAIANLVAGVKKVESQVTVR